MLCVAPAKLEAKEREARPRGKVIRQLSFTGKRQGAREERLRSYCWVRGGRGGGVGTEGDRGEGETSFCGRSP